MGPGVDYQLYTNFKRESPSPTDTTTITWLIRSSRVYRSYICISDYGKGTRESARHVCLVRRPLKHPMPLSPSTYIAPAFQQCYV